MTSLKRSLWLLLFISVCVSSRFAVSGPLYTDKYDAPIQKSVKRWWPDYTDHLMWKAQIYQESRFNEQAVSPVGARGLAQIMPSTWDDLLKQVGNRDAPSPFAADEAIDLGAYYQGKLRRGWGAEGRTSVQRNELAQASYNAGMGSILKAQALCMNPRLWGEIAPCLAEVTGERNARETNGYVLNIRRWRSLMN